MGHFIKLNVQKPADEERAEFLNAERARIRGEAKVISNFSNDPTVSVDEIKRQLLPYQLGLAEDANRVKKVEAELAKKEAEAKRQLIQEFIAKANGKVIDGNPDDPDVRVLAEEVETEYTYLLYPYFAFGTVTAISAAGGTGKGTLCNYFTALASSGRFNEIGKTDCHEPINVLIFTIEDSPASKILPEVKLAGGNPNKIFTCKGTKDGGSFSFADEDKFFKALEMHKPRLVIIDNAGDFGDPNNNGNDYKAVTKELTLLSRLAERYNAAVVLILHENKSGGFMGSAAYANKVRSLCTYKKTEEERVNIFRHEKKNIHQGPPLLFKGNEVVVPGRQYPVWSIEPLGVAKSESFEEKIKPVQLQANDVLAEMIAHGPVSNSELLARFAVNGWNKVHLTRARKLIGAKIITLAGINYTCNALDYIKSSGLLDD